MQDAATVQRIAAKFRALGPLMDERMRRQWAAVEAVSYGWGGIRAVSEATGLSPTTIRNGRVELRARTERQGEPDTPTPRERRAKAEDPLRLPTAGSRTTYRPLLRLAVRAPGSLPL